MVNYKSIHVFEFKDRSAVLDTIPIFVMGDYRNGRTIFMLDCLMKTKIATEQKLFEEAEKRLKRIIETFEESATQEETFQLGNFRDIVELLKHNTGFRKAQDQTGALYNFINEIIDLRIRRKYSHTKLSEVLGIPSSTIALLEIGKHNPSFKSMNAISKALGGKLYI